MILIIVILLVLFKLLNSYSSYVLLFLLWSWTSFSSYDLFKYKYKHKHNDNNKDHKLRKKTLEADDNNIVLLFGNWLYSFINNLFFFGFIFDSSSSYSETWFKYLFLIWNSFFWTKGFIVLIEYWTGLYLSTKKLTHLLYNSSFQFSFLLIFLLLFFISSGSQGSCGCDGDGVKTTITITFHLELHIFKIVSKHLTLSVNKDFLKEINGIFAEDEYIVQYTDQAVNLFNLILSNNSGSCEIIDGFIAWELVKSFKLGAEGDYPGLTCFSSDVIAYLRSPGSMEMSTELVRSKLSYLIRLNECSAAWSESRENLDNNILDILKIIIELNLSKLSADVPLQHVIYVFRINGKIVSIDEFIKKYNTCNNNKLYNTVVEVDLGKMEVNLNYCFLLP